MNHLRLLEDLTPDDVEQILDRSAELKAGLKNGDRSPLLAGRTLSLLFEKPSLRTRVSFEAAMVQLGGGCSFQSMKDAGVGGRESLADVTRVLTSYVDVVALRTFSQQLIADFSALAHCPVINALSDERHPCQALTDLLTMREVHHNLADHHLVYVGDGNNVARSLCVATAMAGMPLTVCTPPDYALADDFLNTVRQQYAATDIRTSNEPADAVKDASFVYTDVWASMGQESEADARSKAFAGFQINAVLMAKAPKTCRFMHDLPARRGLEVTDEVMDGEQSIVFQQAENRMHLAKGLLVWLLVDNA